MPLCPAAWSAYVEEVIKLYNGDGAGDDDDGDDDHDDDDDRNSCISCKSNNWNNDVDHKYTHDGDNDNNYDDSNIVILHVVLHSSYLNFCKTFDCCFLGWSIYSRLIHQCVINVRIPLPELSYHLDSDCDDNDDDDDDGNDEEDHDNNHDRDHDDNINNIPCKSNTENNYIDHR